MRLGDKMQLSNTAVIEPGALSGGPSVAAAPRPCTICGGGNFRHLTQDAGYDWEICSDCEFVRLTRDLTFDDEVALQDADMAAGYIDGYTRKVAKKLAISRQRLRLITRRVKSGSFLDVGSNYGFMTEVAGQSGFAATGLEINPGLARHAAQTYPLRRFVSSPLETFDAGGAQFDAVYCSEVIEHVVDPRRFLASLAKLMRHGSVLLLTTPHIREYRRRGYRQMKAPDHKVYFNHANLRRLMQECGFTRVRFRFNPFKGIILTALRT
jgi:2-polyprenyl-3-methyl-5-hydroxy-6-metoxy-1,4-benzoquinol methylase